MLERTKACMVVLIGTLALSACASSQEPEGLMGNTNWLSKCNTDDDCSDNLSCVCGTCTRECEVASDCDGLEAAECRAGSLLARGTACETPSVPNVCLATCENDETCGSGYECVASSCLPITDARDSPSGVELGSEACGPTGVYASVNVQPDGECVFSTQGDSELAIGLYDISTGFNGDTNNCDDPYRLNMLVHSCLSGASDTLQIHSAEVRLTDIDRNTILFDRGEPSLANPFLVTTTGVVGPMEDGVPSRAIAVIEAIPKAYTQQLDGFADLRILAEIQIFGTTVGDADIDLRKLTYTIDICDGCLTIDGCSLPAEISLDEVYGEGVCSDNAGADGRVCIDFVCGR
jgi:hypothetical protein